MIAEVAGQQLVTDVASLLGALTAIAAVCAAAFRLRPVRWLGRTLIGDPISHWLRAELREQVQPIIAELKPNGGSSTRDAIDRLERHREAEDRERRIRQDRLDERLDSIDAVLSQVQPIIADWRRSHPEIRPDLDDDGPQS